MGSPFTGNYNIKSQSNIAEVCNEKRKTSGKYRQAFVIRNEVV